MIPLAMLPETVTIEAYEGDNGHGQPIYSATISVRARFEARRRLVKREGGQEVISSGTVLIRQQDGRPDCWPVAVELPIGSRVTREGRAYKVVDVLPVMEFKRVHHLEVLVS